MSDHRFINHFDSYGCRVADIAELKAVVDFYEVLSELHAAVSAARPLETATAKPIFDSLCEAMLSSGMRGEFSPAAQILKNTTEIISMTRDNPRLPQKLKEHQKYVKNLGNKEKYISITCFVAALALIVAPTLLVCILLAGPVLIPAMFLALSGSVLPFAIMSTIGSEFCCKSTGLKKIGRDVSDLIENKPRAAPSYDASSFRFYAAGADASYRIGAGDLFAISAVTAGLSLAAFSTVVAFT